jgi:predicted amidohydrolase YtcJ
MSKLYADLVLLNGKIVTVDEKDSVEEAVAVKFGRILAVGKNDRSETWWARALRSSTSAGGL